MPTTYRHEPRIEHEEPPAMTQPPQQPPMTPGVPAAPAGPTPTAKRPWVARHKIATVLLALLGVGILGSLFGDDEPAPASSPAPSVTSTTSTTTEPVATTEETTTTKEATTTTKATPPSKPTKELSAGQRNALRSAENYLSFAAFSRKGLIEQLSSSAGDGYSRKDATYAADHVKVDWNEQAAKAAKNYLSISPFSRSAMIQQLESSAGDDYTHAQAVYGAKKAGL